MENKTCPVKPGQNKGGRVDLKELIEKSDQVMLRNYEWKGKTWEKIVLARHKEISGGTEKIIPFGIFINSRILGPALGGLRMRSDYQSFQEFFEDGLLLSDGMTHKASLAGLNLGGGKAVVFANPKTDKTEALLRKIGQTIEQLHGDYITAEDMGTSTSDMAIIAKETANVVGKPRGDDGNGSGDPSLMTALGVFQGIKASLYFLTGSSQISGRTFAIQGIGHCGFRVARHLHEAGGIIIVSDVNKEMTERAANEFGARIVPQEEIFGAECDVFVPCAIGGIINDETIAKFQCKIVAGSANNQLADEEKHGKMLLEKEIIYAPDYAINAGGLINVSMELAQGGYNELKARIKTMGIYNIILNILQQSKDQNVPPHTIAATLAKKRIEAVKKSKKEVDDYWA